MKPDHKVDQGWAAGPITSQIFEAGFGVKDREAAAAGGGPKARP